MLDDSVDAVWREAQVPTTCVVAEILDSFGDVCDELNSGVVGELAALELEAEDLEIRQCLHSIKDSSGRLFVGRDDFEVESAQLGATEDELLYLLAQFRAEDMVLVNPLERSDIWTRKIRAATLLDSREGLDGR